MDSDELKKHRDATPDELLTLTLDSYRTALEAMGSCGVQTCSALGPELQRGLMMAAERLAKKLTAPIVKETEEQIKEHLPQWGGANRRVLSPTGRRCKGNPDGAGPYRRVLRGTRLALYQPVQSTRFRK